MTLSVRVRAAGVLTAVLSSVGCYVSKFPMDAQPQADADQGVVGVWRCVPHGATVTERPATITVAPAVKRVYAVTFQEDGKDASRYEAHASIVGGEKLFNIRDLSGGSEPWVFMRYALLRPSVLHLQALNGDALKEQESPSALRAAVERLQGKANAYVDFSVCARARAAEASEK
jgi:hypothetical protein